MLLLRRGQYIMKTRATKKDRQEMQRTWFKFGVPMVPLLCSPQHLHYSKSGRDEESVNSPHYVQHRVSALESA